MKDSWNSDNVSKKFLIPSGQQTGKNKTWKDIRVPTYCQVSTLEYMICTHSINHGITLCSLLYMYMRVIPPLKRCSTFLATVTNTLFNILYQWMQTSKLRVWHELHLYHIQVTQCSGILTFGGGRSVEDSRSKVIGGGKSLPSFKTESNYSLFTGLVCWS